MLHEIMHETIEGPSGEMLHTDDDYSEFVDEATFAARPNHEAELSYFKEPRNGRVISADTLLSFIHFKVCPPALRRAPPQRRGVATCRRENTRRDVTSKPRPVAPTRDTDTCVGDVHAPTRLS